MASSNRASVRIGTSNILIGRSALQQRQKFRLPSIKIHTDGHKEALNFFMRIGFGLGHFFNDLSAVLWCSYTIFFLNSVAKAPIAVAGCLFALGQFADAIATPVVGSLAEHFGPKRLWHLCGTILVAITFSLIYSFCPGCEYYDTNTFNWWIIVYYSIFIVLFQIGWPTVQLSFLNILTDMTVTQKDRSEITVTIYINYVVANVCFYCLTLMILKKLQDGTGVEKAAEFRKMTLILTSIGLIMSILFQIALTVKGYRQRRTIPTDLLGNILRANLVRDDSVATTGDEISFKDFLKLPRFYQTGLLFMFAKLNENISLLYSPLWLYHLSTQEDFPNLATAPLLSFLASFITTLLLKYTKKWIKMEFSYSFGMVVSICVCCWVGTAPTSLLTSLAFHLMSFAFGFSSAITVVSSTELITSMIGSQLHVSSLVISMISFCDKLLFGIIVMIISICTDDDSQCLAEYYQTILTYGCGVPAILGLLILITLLF